MHFSSLVCILILFTSLAASAQQTSTSKLPVLESQYVLGPDSYAQPGGPEGRVLALTLPDSKVYPGVSHNWWLYIPAQYDGTAPLAVMVFLDGDLFVPRDKFGHVPVVLDNLIAKKEIPMMTAVFIQPGPGISINTKPHTPPFLDNSNRSLEYDTMDSTYATFILNEIFPEVRKHVRITDDPAGRGIAGLSSSGIAAFTVAWQRPDQFRKVLSFVGSFTNKRGGHVYPDLVRQSERKPLTVFQQSGEKDMKHRVWGSWPEANKAMAAALQEKGYDHKFVFGQGGHNFIHGASILPEALRWVWRDYPR